MPARCAGQDSAATHRVAWPERGVVVAHVPWARHGSRLTLAFEDLACWLATRCNQTVLARYLRTTWRSIGHVIEGRVAMTDWPVVATQLRRIGIDEISYRKGQRYWTVVADHESGRLAWARRSQIARFAALAQTITEHRDGIRASIGRGASNGRVEAMNTGIHLLARKAYGFHSPDGMISLATLKHGGLCPPLPGR